MTTMYNLNQGEKCAELFIDGEIVTEKGWFDGGAIEAKEFRKSLAKVDAVTVYINSPGGDVFAASDMYAALREHPGRVTVKITGIAASAASVVAMAGDEVLIAPTAYMMIHDPWTVAVGNASEMEHQAQILREVGEGILNAYEAKTGLARDAIRDMLQAETYMNAQTCVDMGFCDGMLDAGAPVKASMMRARNYAPQAILAKMPLPKEERDPVRTDCARYAAVLLNLYDEMRRNNP